MKKSIKFLAIALLAAGAANANLAKVSTPETQTRIDSSLTGEKTAKYVSFANPELLKTELGTLVKTQPSIDDAISADAQLTEAAVVTYLPAKKKQGKKVYPKAIRN